MAAIQSTARQPVWIHRALEGGYMPLSGKPRAFVYVENTSWAPVPGARQGDYVHVRYIGPAQALVAAGAATADMVVSGRRPGAQRKDAQGHPFRRIVRVPKKGILSIDRWISDRAYAVTLPGVPASFAHRPGAAICSDALSLPDIALPDELAAEALEDILEECDAHLAKGGRRTDQARALYDRAVGVLTVPAIILDAAALEQLLEDAAARIESGNDDDAPTIGTAQLVARAGLRALGRS